MENSKLKHQGKLKEETVKLEEGFLMVSCLGLSK